MARQLVLQLLVFLVVAASSTSGGGATTFTMTNNCGYTVWPGILPNAGSPAMSTSGFSLAPGQSQAIVAPAGWSGRLWGRTLCATDSQGRFSCVTGDCGSGAVACSGGNAAPPVTLAEFTLDGSGGNDFYDVSLVDGYNLPVLVTPAPAVGASSSCEATGCVADVNAACPANLRVTSSSAAAATTASVDGGAAAVVACRSACEAFGSAQYCCSGAYASAATCQPTAYSELFKSQCPRAYSYAFDDSTSTFTCAAAAGYGITFCPSSASVKSSGSSPQLAGLPLVNSSTMTYLGGNEFSGANAATGPSIITVAAALSTAVLLFWRRP